jgi:hypothetical protein
LPDDKNFPQSVKLDIPGGNTYDDSLHKIEVDEYEWGYLKDLYINFDFFCDTMEKSGMVSKDIALELLNGLSSGVNLFWNFQLVNDGSKGKDDNGNEILQVVDMSFNGKPPNSFEGLAVFQSIAENSPFLEFQIKLEIAGAMANQIMAQQMTDESSFNVEDKVENMITGLFAKGPDPVALQLNRIYKTVDEKAQDEKSKKRKATRQEKERESAEKYEKLKSTGQLGASDVWDKLGQVWDDTDDDTNIFSEGAKEVGALLTQTADAIRENTVVFFGGETDVQKEARESNYEVFLQKAGVYPKINDPNNMPDLIDGFLDLNAFDDVKLDDKSIVCAIWNDSQLLRQIYEHDLNAGGLGYLTTSKKNPGYLPIEVTFKIHGVSGIKVGDVLRIIDLPHVYRRKLLQVFNVSNTIDDDLWTTEVTAKLRNVDLV